uniref:Chromosome 1 open reading frame 21 n=1 Tax=Anolis carolinensis TaxID=28377 RepID=H9G6K4_ANOCA
FPSPPPVVQSSVFPLRVLPLRSNQGGFGIVRLSFWQGEWREGSCQRLWAGPLAREGGVASARRGRGGPWLRKAPLLLRSRRELFLVSLLPQLIPSEPACQPASQPSISSVTQSVARPPPSQKRSLRGKTGKKEGRQEGEPGRDARPAAGEDEYRIKPVEEVKYMKNGGEDDQKIAARNQENLEKSASTHVRLKTNKELPGLVHQPRANMHISESQQEFFRMLDEKIEKGRDYCSEEEDIT